MLTFLVVVFSLSFLVLGHEAGHFFVAKLFRLKVDEFGFGFPPRIFAKKSGETEYSLNWLPFGGFVKIAGENDHLTDEEKQHGVKNDAERLFSFQPAWKRSAIILAGVAVNFLIGWILISAVLMIGTPSSIVVTGVQDDSPAALAGVRAGDVVKEYTTAEPFLYFIQSHKGEEITLSFLRGDKEFSFSMIPRTQTQENEGALGITFVEGGEPAQPFFAALWNGMIQSGRVFWLTITGFYELLKTFFTHGNLAEGVVGPVGIFSVAQKTAAIGTIYLAELVALISINLSVVNLIPFPALDGGRFLMILIEKAKGSPVSQKTERVVNTVGFALLLLLMVVVTARDIVNL